MSHQTVVPLPPAKPPLTKEDLALLRRVQGLSLKTLADRAGIAASTLWALEQGRRPLTPEVTLRLLRALWGEI